MKKAHIVSGGVVTNTVMVDTIDKPYMLDADLVGGGIGWAWDGDRLTPPAPLPSWSSVDAGRADLLAAVNRRCESMLSVLKAGYPESEVLSWPQQCADAASLAIGGPSPLIDALALARGIDRVLLAGKVVEKATLFAMASGAIIGNRQRLEFDLECAESFEGLSLIDTSAGWPMF